jgi:putative addiction module component (TIGR02574 family)
MTEERKPPMSIEEIEAAALDLSPQERIALLERIEDSLFSDDADPEDVADSRRIMEEIRAGRMKTVPSEDVLRELEAAALQVSEEDRAEFTDRIISSVVGAEGYDPAWIAEITRRMDEIEAGTARTIPAEEVFAKMRARRDARSLPR